MARYQVVENSFINGRYYNAKQAAELGLEPLFVDYDGDPGPNLKPADEDAKKKASKIKELIAKDAKRLSKAADGVEDAAELAASA